MRPYRHRRSRPRRLNHTARTLLLLCWLAVTLGLAKLGFPAEWVAVIFLLGPIVGVAGPVLLRWMIAGSSHQRGGVRVDWSFIAIVASVAIVGFCAVLWWPWPFSESVSATNPEPVLFSASAATTASFSCRVASVHDGDTLRCADGTRIRLHAIAAREIDETCSEGHPCPAASAEAARLELVKLAQNRTLDCRRTGRSYNRVTAICDNDDGVEINCAMVRTGTTVIWDRFHQEHPICARG